MRIRGSCFLKIVIFTLVSIEVFFSPAVSFSQSADKVKRYDPTLLITVEELSRKKAENASLMLIDVRKTDDFARLRIPNSINIPLYAIKTKSFLKTKTLMIIHEGYGYSRLESECMQLRKKGFRVFILHGGLHFWIKNNLPLEGNVSGKSLSAIVPPLIFIKEREFNNWIIVDVSGSRSVRESDRSSGFYVPYLGKKDLFLNELEQVLKKQNMDPHSLIIMIDEKGDTYDKLETILEKTPFHNAFYLEGGKQGLKQISTVRTEDDVYKDKQLKGSKRNTCK